MPIMIASIFVLYYTRRWLLPDLLNITIPCPEVQSSLWSELRTHYSQRHEARPSAGRFCIKLLCSTYVCSFTGTVRILPSPAKLSVKHAPSDGGAGSWGLQGWPLPQGGASQLQWAQHSHSWVQQWCWQQSWESVFKKVKNKYLCMLIICPLSLLLAVLVLGRCDAW